MLFGRFMDVIYWCMMSCDELSLNNHWFYGYSVYPLLLACTICVLCIISILFVHVMPTEAFALSTVEIVTTVVDNLPKFLPRATASGLE